MSQRLDALREIRALQPKEISGRITEAHKKLTLLRQEKLLGKLKNPKELGQLKKTIARLRTVLDEKVSESLKETNHD